jgi:Ca2+/H+ antiporter
VPPAWCWSLSIVIASMRVAHHAELLAEKVGDP